MDRFHRSPEGIGDTSEADALLPGRSKETLDDERLAQIITAQEAAAQSYVQSNLSAQRARALAYYRGDPFGNEAEGQSQVVSRDVYEAVEGMLPSLLEIFLGSNRLGECEPTGPEDEQEAKQQTDAANYVIFKQNNPINIFYPWFKNALLQKTAVVKTYYETEDEYRISQWAGMTREELLFVLQDTEKVEPVEVLQREIQIEGRPFEVYDLKARVKTKREKICIKPIAPENFLVSIRQGSLDLNECEFAAHKEKKTRTDLLEMGVEEAFLENVGDGGSELEFSEESIQRDQYNVVSNRDSHQDDESMREYWVSDGVILVDLDGDGKAELRHFIKIGDKVWMNEETDYVPFSAICPIPLPHQFYGLSLFDATEDIQFNKSVLWREMLNNLYLTNRPRLQVLDGQANIDDLLTSRVGGIVRVRAPGAVAPLETHFVARESFPMIEYMDSVRENRTGNTRYNQGMDADSLNKTAHGIQAILGQSQKRGELIAKLFAETGVKDVFKKVLHCISSSGMKAMVMKVTNGYVSIDPREWTQQFNITINVGLGTGTKDAVIQKLLLVSQKQLELKQTGRGYMVTEENDYNTCSKIAEAAGFKNPELFFTDPRMVPSQAKQAPPPIDILKLQQDRELKLADMQVTSQQKDKDMANDRWIEAMKAQKDQETKIAVAQIGGQTQTNVANISADTQKKSKLADAMLKDHEMRGDAEMEVFRANEERQKPNEAVAAVIEALGKAMLPVVQAIQQGNEQNAQGFQVLGDKLDLLAKQAMAPRKKVKDSAGKTVGVEVEGFGTVSVQ